MKTATTRCCGFELDSTRWSHNVNNWPSTISSAVCCHRRRAYITLSAARQAWRLRHRKTAPCNNIWTSKNKDC